MRSTHQTKTPAVAGPGLSGKTRIVGEVILAKFRRQVNEIRIAGLLFGRDLLLAGLVICGFPWSRRLSLWVDWIDSRAEELRDVVRGRV